MPFDTHFPNDGKFRSSLPKVNKDRWNPRAPFNIPQRAISDPGPRTNDDHLAACRLDVLRLEEALLVRGVKPLKQNDRPMTFNEGYKKGFDVGREEGIRIGRKEGADDEVERWVRDVSSSQFDDKHVGDREGCVTIEIWKIRAMVWFFCLVVLPTFVWCLWMS
jgi:hypothetical protein